MKSLIVLFVALLLLVGVPLWAYTMRDYSIQSGSAVSRGGPNYTARITLGQTVSAKASSNRYQLILGFWHPPYAPLYHFLLGDVNNDGQVNALDVEYLSQYLYFNGPTPAVPAQADVNQDHEINDADLVALTHLLWH